MCSVYSAHLVLSFFLRFETSEMSLVYTQLLLPLEVFHLYHILREQRVFAEVQLLNKENFKETGSG